MEDVEQKLNTGNPALISQIISRLVENIKEKFDQTDKKLLEFKILIEKSYCHDDNVNIVASNGIIHLIKQNILSADSVLDDFCSILPTVKFSHNVAFLINALLQLEATKQDYKNKFNLKMPQHPFIIMLNEDLNCFNSIFREISYSYETDLYCIEIYKPFFLYIICDPTPSPQTSLIKQKLWSLIVANSKPNTNLLALLGWMNFESRSSVQVNSDLLVELAEVNVDRNILNPDLVLLLQASALYHLILNKFDPRAVIFSIEYVLNYHDDLTVWNSVLIVIAKSIPICCSVHLPLLLSLCKLLVKKTNIGPFIKEMIQASLLFWIPSSSLLTTTTIQEANELFTILSNTRPVIIKNRKNEALLENYTFLESHVEIFNCLKLNNLTENWQNTDDVINWLNKLTDVSDWFLNRNRHFLYALLLAEFNNNDIPSTILNLIMRCTNYTKTIVFNILYLTLYKITTTTNPQLHLNLLKNLPKLATMDTSRIIATTLKALTKGRSTIQNFSVRLLFDLWQKENNTYPYLENCLVAPCDPSCENKWEFYVTRALILKELCSLKPELYGKDLVPHLSKILNDCNNPDGAVACALAIDGISVLCKHEVIDAVTTWATLAPLLQNDKRLPVIKSLCHLISEIPTLPYIDAYPNLIEEVTQQLWHYITMELDPDVWEAALTALTFFTMDQIISQMPENYLGEEFSQMKKSELTVPGQCWVNFLKISPEKNLKTAGDFLIKMCSLEISKYLKFVYQVKGVREPVNYSYLPTDSLIRGLTSYIKENLSKWKGGPYHNVYLECLRVLSTEYSKPLPPLDWCFLQEIFHESEGRNYCIDLGSHQVILSGTARRFIVNYIEAMTENCNEVQMIGIYKNLKYLTNSVQPFTLKPFLERTLLTAVQLFHQEGDAKLELLRILLGYVGETLKDDKIQEANKTVIAEILRTILTETDSSAKIFQLLLDCIICLPHNIIIEMTSHKNEPMTDESWFRKIVEIKCHLAVKTTNSPLNCLNDIIQKAPNFPNLILYIFEKMAAVFKHHRETKDCALWMVDLLGQMQFSQDKNQIYFQCDVFMLAAIVFSGHFVFMTNLTLDKIKSLFPVSIACLLDCSHWSVCANQALEWFYHMANEENTKSDYKALFRRALQSMRNDEEFRKNTKWTKYLCIECS